jgi:serine protease
MTPRGSGRGRLGVLATVVALVAPPLAAASPATTAAPTAAGAAAAVRPPDDPLFRYQWNLHAIGIPRAWAVSRGAGAVVAVLDTGIAYETRGPYRRAPDLAGTRFVAGWDFVGNDSHPNDVAPRGGRRSHGTQMAGLIAQTTGNGLGAAGVAPAAALMPIRVLRSDLSGSARDVARGLRFAADHGADVANLSFTGLSERRDVRAAVRYAVAKGVTVVAAAGNEGSPPVSWPAADPRVLAVGAVGRDLTRAPYSNYGPALDLVAPAGAGADVPTGYGPPDGVVAQTLKGGPGTFCLCFTASTSAAAAQVSGVAALLVGSGRATRPAAVRAGLLRSARDLGRAGRDDEYGAGLVQAAAALGVAAARPAAPKIRRPAPAGDADPDSSPLLPIAGAVLVILLLAVLATAIRRRGRRRAR